jgi:hypothetical protein
MGGNKSCRESPRRATKWNIMGNKQKVKNRRDHYLPQGYLRGFIDPARAKLAKPLWCFHLYSKRWRECGPKEIGYIDGFYDYAIENTTAEHPDSRPSPNY